MSLQLYQVDQKSYLLDFKSLSNVEIHESMSSSSSIESTRMPQSPPSSCSDLGELSPPVTSRVYFEYFNFLPDSLPQYSDDVILLLLQKALVLIGRSLSWQKSLRNCLTA